MGTDSDFNFSTGRLGNSRSRPGFMRLGARTDPTDSIDFFNVKDTDQAFALTVQRIKDILTGVVARRVSLAGGLAVARHTSNTVPVMRGAHPLGVAIFVQPTDPFLAPTNAVMPGDVWVK